MGPAFSSARQIRQKPAPAVRAFPHAGAARPRWVAFTRAEAYSALVRLAPSLGGELLENRTDRTEVRVDPEGRVEGEQRRGAIAFTEADLAEAADRAEVTGLERERPLDVLDALGVAAETEIERGTLVPGLGVVGVGLDQVVEDRLALRVVAGRDRARRALELRFGGRVGMRHPGGPDVLLHAARLAWPARAADVPEERIEPRSERRRRPPPGEGEDELQRVLVHGASLLNGSRASG